MRRQCILVIFITFVISSPLQVKAQSNDLLPAFILLTTEHHDAFIAPDLPPLAEGGPIAADIPTSLAPGWHRLEVTATDSAGNTSDLHATQPINVMDPLGRDLNTELFSPSDDLSAGNLSIIHGIAYDLQDETVARVDYRLNGDSWQMTIPKDGNFDSSCEPFTLSIEFVKPGNYLIEAFATDAKGNQEINIANLQIEIAEMHTTYLPLLMR
jgi:hypothetical protein